MFPSMVFTASPHHIQEIHTTQRELMDNIVEDTGLSTALDYMSQHVSQIHDRFYKEALARGFDIEAAQTVAESLTRNTVDLFLGTTTPQ